MAGQWQEAVDYVHLQMDGRGTGGLRSAFDGEGLTQLMPERTDFHLVPQQQAACHLRDGCLPSLSAGSFPITIKSLGLHPPEAPEHPEL